jgi:hypothetical protein
MLGYNAVWSIQSQAQMLANCFHTGFSLGFFYPEDGYDFFFRNVGSLSRDYMALYPKTYHCSASVRCAL